MARKSAKKAQRTGRSKKLTGGRTLKKVQNMRKAGEKPVEY